MDTNLCLYEWRDWCESIPAFDVVVKIPKDKKHDLCHILLADGVEVWESYHWEAVLNAWDTQTLTEDA